ncbi:hypothetical protein ACFX14_035112 [Malus domestica]
MKIAKEEGVINIKLMKGPIKGRCNGQSARDIGHFSSGRESVMVIDTLHLNVTLSDQMSFVALNGPIRMMFNLVDLFATNWRLARRKMSESPRAILGQRLQLRLHNNLPVRVRSSLDICTRFHIMVNMVNISKMCG